MNATEITVGVLGVITGASLQQWWRTRRMLKRALNYRPTWRTSVRAVDDAIRVLVVKPPSPRQAHETDEVRIVVGEVKLDDEDLVDKLGALRVKAEDRATTLTAVQEENTYR